MSDGMIILLVFGILILVPLVVVFGVLGCIKLNRKRKVNNYKGCTEGTILKIVDKHAEHPGTITVQYMVSGITYEIRETLKLKSEAIKVGRIPIGQKKTYVLGRIQEGDSITVLYDEKQPQKAIIMGNDGVMNV